MRRRQWVPPCVSSTRGSIAARSSFPRLDVPLTVHVRLYAWAQETRLVVDRGATARRMPPSAFRPLEAKGPGERDLKRGPETESARVERRPNRMRYVALLGPLVLGACGAPRQTAARRPDADVTRTAVPIEVSRACGDAPTLEHRSSRKLTFGPRTRVLAVRVRVEAADPGRPRDLGKGDGEVGFGGAKRGLDFHVLDEAGDEVGAGSSQACFDHHARLPDVPGVYCVALSPQDDRENPSIEVDYAARQHGLGLVQMPEEDVIANIEGVCGYRP